MNHDDEKISRLFKDSFRKDIDWQALEGEKKQFLKTHFEARPVWILRPAFLVPAAGFAVAFAAFMMLMPEKIEKPEHAPFVQSLVSADRPGETAAQAPAPETSATVSSAAKPAEGQPVLVQELRSDTGTPMVFQRRTADASFVVIWVFPRHTPGGV